MEDREGGPLIDLSQSTDDEGGRPPRRPPAVAAGGGGSGRESREIIEIDDSSDDESRGPRVPAARMSGGTGGGVGRGRADSLSSVDSLENLSQFSQFSMPGRGGDDGAGSQRSKGFTPKSTPTSPADGTPASASSKLGTPLPSSPDGASPRKKYGRRPRGPRRRRFPFGTRDEGPAPDDADDGGEERGASAARVTTEEVPDVMGFKSRLIRGTLGGRRVTASPAPPGRDAGASGLGLYADANRRSVLAANPGSDGGEADEILSVMFESLPEDQKRMWNEMAEKGGGRRGPVTSFDRCRRPVASDPSPEDRGAAERPAAGPTARLARELYEEASRGFLEAGHPDATPDEIRTMLLGGFLRLSADERRTWEEKARAHGPSSDGPAGAGSDRKGPGMGLAAPLEHYHKLHMPRRRLARWCNLPNFQEAVTGFFVRVITGRDGATGKSTYQVCRIAGVVTMARKEYGFPASTGGVRTDKHLVLAVGRRTTTVKMVQVSDKRPTAEEVRRLIDEQLRSGGMQAAMLTKEEVERLRRRQDELIEGRAANRMVESLMSGMSSGRKRLLDARRERIKRARTGRSKSRGVKSEGVKSEKVKSENDEPNGDGDGRKEVVEEEADEMTYAPYRPSKLRYGLAHPDPVVENATLAAVEPPDVTYNLAMPADIISEGRLSDLQVRFVLRILFGTEEDLRCRHFHAASEPDTLISNMGPSLILHRSSRRSCTAASGTRSTCPSRRTPSGRRKEE